MSFIMRMLFLTSSKLLVEEAYYWNYAMHLDFGYLDHPPLVAVLIKLGTLIFGNHEFAVRIASPVCWAGTVYFSYKLTEYLHKDAGIYAIFLLSILPFPFIHSMIITPDVPLLLAWSAALYYLYQALILEKPIAWYQAGFWCGLGLLAKYTIILLVVSTFVYLLIAKNARKWFTKKEPWLAFVLMMLIFSPVIYWNATHDWASFAFQGTRRFVDKFHFSLPAFTGLLVLFLTPAGLWGLYKLYENDTPWFIMQETAKTRVFLLCYTLIPLIFFGLFSLFRMVKLNWTGPVVLALLPWLAIQMYRGISWKNRDIRKIWLGTSIVILCGQCVLFLIIWIGQPYLFRKYINWETFTLQIHQILKETHPQTTPMIIPLDLYNLASELNFYQTKLFARGEIDRIYPISGSQVFGLSSLMYAYWTPAQLISGQPIVLLGWDKNEFQDVDMARYVEPQSALLSVFPETQGSRKTSLPYYYQFGIAR